MPEFFINGQPVHAERDQTVMQAALAAGYATVGILAKYCDEFEYWIEHKRSRLDGNLEALAHA